MGCIRAQAPSAVCWHLPAPSGPCDLYHLTLLLAGVSAPGVGQGLPAFGRASAGWGAGVMSFSNQTLVCFLVISKEENKFLL